MTSGKTFNLHKHAREYPRRQCISYCTIVTIGTMQVEEELARQKLINQQTKDRHARLKMDNLDLREKICLLERLDMYTYRRESACMVEFQQLHLKETY
jgi:hypothetical protein